MDRWPGRDRNRNGQSWTEAEWQIGKNRPREKGTETDRWEKIETEGNTDK